MQPRKTTAAVHLPQHIRILQSSPEEQGPGANSAQAEAPRLQNTREIITRI